jgi:hypothetical protein
LSGNFVPLDQNQPGVNAIQLLHCWQ